MPTIKRLNPSNILFLSQLQAGIPFPHSVLCASISLSFLTHVSLHNSDYSEILLFFCPNRHFTPFASLNSGIKKTKTSFFSPNFCPKTTTSCGQTLLFLLFSYPNLLGLYCIIITHSTCHECAIMMHIP